MKNLKPLISRNYLWRQLRDVQAEGFARAGQRVRVWSKILDTKPIITEPANRSAAVEIHLLTYHRDYLSSIWALKSFYHYAQVSYPLTIHVQGRPTSRMMTRLRAHFPNATLLTQFEANNLAESWLSKRGYPRLLAARRASVMMMKLIDFIVACNATHMLALDSDVVFFRRPEELLAATNTPLPYDLYMHDAASSYNIAESRALEELGINLAPRVNCGVMLFPADTDRLDRCEHYLTHPQVAQPNGLIEQTMHALYASERNRVKYLPDNYFISPAETSVELDELVCRHYAGSSRALLTDEGFPRLIQQGFLDELRAR